MQQFQVPFLFFTAVKPLTSSPIPRAVDVVHVRKIEQNLHALVVQQSAGLCFAAKRSRHECDAGRSSPQSNFPRRDVWRAVPSLFLYAPWCGAALWPPSHWGTARRWQFLDITISRAAGFSGTTSNSSMKARIRKIPRPDVLRQILSASGSATSESLKSRAFIQHMNNHLVRGQVTRPDESSSGRSWFPLVECVDHAFAHAHADAIAIVFAESAASATREAHLFGEIHAFDLRLQRHFEVLGVRRHVL